MAEEELAAAAAGAGDTCGTLAVSTATSPERPARAGAVAAAGGGGGGEGEDEEEEEEEGGDGTIEVDEDDDSKVCGAGGAGKAAGTKRPRESRPRVPPEKRWELIVAGKEGPYKWVDFNAFDVSTSARRLFLGSKKLVCRWCTDAYPSRGTCVLDVTKFSNAKKHTDTESHAAVDPSKRVEARGGQQTLSSFVSKLGGPRTKEGYKDLRREKILVKCSLDRSLNVSDTQHPVVS